MSMRSVLKFPKNYDAVDSFLSVDESSKAKGAGGGGFKWAS